MWPFEQQVATMSLRVQHLEIPVDTKTKDNVFVVVSIAVQYKVVADKVSSAYYKLTDPQGMRIFVRIRTTYLLTILCFTGQIRSYVFDCVRSHIPMLLIDEAFESKVSIQFIYIVYMSALYIYIPINRYPYPT